MASAMFSDSIELLKREYTDKYVAVDDSRPELARFRGVVGQVKTVNMSGRALVEFQDYFLNIGWFDIDPSFLKVVDKPIAKAPAEKSAEPKKPAEKPAAKAAPAASEKKLSPLELARMQGTGGKGAAAPATAKAEGAKKSTADILAAARGGSAPAAKSEAKPAAEKPTPAAKPAAPKGKLSTADILAAARGGTSEAPAAAAPAKTAAPEPPAAPPAPAAKAETVAGGVVRVDRSTMSVADMIAYCRKVDSK